ncbi:lasso RiPP family leader peptide-containing protein [Actinophytocola gossypii]|uniref:Lasso RiPP family leader peptide-containing protein n=1 Tax=Actinophytocola gossypii TaxID=2812003 RepID=A0ABT2JD99_9PSEU|nr:lasso RiPP family leader peptide-containing protein [Actinophytocola gossypii]MCT2585751.1 lasso RiPP family leader peptide-containing protein [Actinophytocola gossypii]
MRQPYEAPELTALGSLTDVTQANLFGESSDNLTWILPIFGDDDNYS